MALHSDTNCVSVSVIRSDRNLFAFDSVSLKRSDSLALLFDGKGVNRVLLRQYGNLCLGCTLVEREAAAECN